MIVNFEKPMTAREYFEKNHPGESPEMILEELDKSYVARMYAIDQELGEIVEALEEVEKMGTEAEMAEAAEEAGVKTPYTAFEKERNERMREKMHELEQQMENRMRELKRTGKWKEG